MQALKLLYQNNCQIIDRLNLGKECGQGSDGQVFELVDYPDRVVKFCVLYDGQENIDEMYAKTEKDLSFLEAHSLPICARVYEHNFLAHGVRETSLGEQKYILYYYIMEKLQKTTEDERKVFHSILSHEDRGIVKDFPEPVVRDMLQGMRRGLDFDTEKVILFYNNLRNSPVRHRDIHVRNIMKDKQGNFKLIDFDRIEIGD